MKRFSLLVLIITGVISNNYAQGSLNNYLDAVAAGNKELIAARKMAEAQKFAAKTNINPDNPELEYGYFPGNRDEVGTKQVFSISQSIDFPTTYVYRNKYANKQVDQASLYYQQTQQAVLLQASKYWCTMVFLNRMDATLKKRLTDAQTLVNNYQKKQMSGDATQLEVNKAKLFLLNVNNKKRMNESLIKQTNEIITEFNGGTPFAIADTIFSFETLMDWPTIKAEIDSLLPEYKEQVNQTSLAEINLKLNRSQWLPELMVGYESESILGVKYQGIKAGLSIPLWNDINKVKMAKAELYASESKTESFQSVTNAYFFNQYIEAESLKENLDDFKNSLAEMNNEYLLTRSLQLGQISSIEYFLELDYFYNISDELLNLELAYKLSLVNLYRYKL